MPLYAFVFDMDGVIADSNPYHKIALRQFCEKHGHTLTETELREKIYGRTNKDWIPNLFGDIDPKLVKQYADEKEVLFRDIYAPDRKSTRLNSSHVKISYAVFCLKKK